MSIGKKSVVIAALATISFCTEGAPGPTSKTQTLTHGSVLSLSCYSSAAAAALAQASAGAVPDNWYESFGYASAEAWWAEALAKGVIGLRWNTTFKISRAGPYGAVTRVDLGSDINNATLTVASADSEAYAQSVSVAWQPSMFRWSRQFGSARSFSRGGSRAVGQAGSGTSTNVNNLVFVNGRAIDEFRSQLTFRAESFSSASGAAVSEVLSIAAAEHGWSYTDGFAAAASSALATAIAKSRVVLDLVAHYRAAKSGDGVLASIDSAAVSLQCLGGASAGAEAVAKAYPY